MKYIQCFIFFSALVYIPLVFSVSVSEPEFRTAAHCDSIDGYNQSKQGNFGVEGGRVTIDNETLIINAKVFASQCQRLKNNRFQWKQVSPIGKMYYEHDYFDSTEKILKTRTITVEHKDNWLTVVNDSLLVVGKGNVSGNMQKGFFARVVVSLSDVASDEQLKGLRSGKTQSLHVSLFLKSLMRYIADGESTPYEESGGAGLYDIKFIVHNVNGKYTVE
jgi:hypothetical protein